MSMFFYVVVILAAAETVNGIEYDEMKEFAYVKHHHHLHLKNMSVITHEMGEMNTAVLQIVNSAHHWNLSIWHQSEHCYQCNLRLGVVLAPEADIYIAVDTRWKTLLSVRDHTNKVACDVSQISHKFYEGGNYTLWLTHNDSGFNCIGPLLMNSPHNVYISIMVAFSVLFGVSVFWIVLKYLYTHHHLYCLVPPCCKSPEGYITPDLGIPSVNGITTDEESRSTDMNVRGQHSGEKKARLRSLDCFRGISIVIMIFVNYKGGGYWFFKHATWNGLTVADLVFPWLVFVMGTCILISMSSLVKKRVPKLKILLKIVKRSVILFVLGLVLNSSGKSVALWELRIPGVLQRLGLTYLIVASIHLIFVQVQEPYAVEVWNSPFRGKLSFRDITPYWAEWIIHLVILSVYLCLTYLLRVPGCPVGYVGPGGWGDRGRYVNCTGGAASYIDKLVLGHDHLYPRGTAHKIYHTTVRHDPEGILGTLTSCFLCFLGLQAGKIILNYSHWLSRVSRWLAWGLISLVIATSMCLASRENGIPMNKNLWSVSYILMTGGFSFLLLAFCHITIDHKKVWSGAPFVYPGMNAIVIYICHEVFHHYFPVFFGGYREEHWELLFMNLYGTTLWVVVAYVMYRHKIFISI